MARPAASPSLSQNFLVNPAVADRFAALADPAPAGLLLEVGAGHGALTEALAPHCRSLVAYEIDPRLLPGLRRRLRRHPQVRLVNRDFLADRAPRQPFAVAGSVPYARTSAIVDWCLGAPRLTAATFITQLEYARKRTGDYGRWSLKTVSTWPWYDWRLHGRIPRRDFRPMPRVDSAILRIERRTRPLLPPAHREAYRRLVALGFTGRGGSLHATLRPAYPARALAAAFRDPGLARDTAVGYVTPAQWLGLFRTLHGR